MNEKYIKINNIDYIIRYMNKNDEYIEDIIKLDNELQEYNYKCRIDRENSKENYDNDEYSFKNNLTDGILNNVFKIILLIRCDNNELIGCLLYTKDRNLYDKMDNINIQLFCITKKYRNKGFGKEIVDFLEKDLLTKKSQYILTLRCYLYSDSKNFYRNSDFKSERSNWIRFNKFISNNKQSYESFNDASIIDNTYINNDLSYIKTLESLYINHSKDKINLYKRLNNIYGKNKSKSLESYLYNKSLDINNKCKSYIENSNDDLLLLLKEL